MSEIAAMCIVPPSCVFTYLNLINQILNLAFVFKEQNMAHFLCDSSGQLRSIIEGLQKILLSLLLLISVFGSPSDRG